MQKLFWVQQNNSLIYVYSGTDVLAVVEIHGIHTKTAQRTY